MEKLFAISVSGLYAVMGTGVACVPVVFAQVDALSFLGLAERLGLGVVMAILGYKILIKIIDIFGPPLIARLNDHDTDVKTELSSIKQKIEELDTHIITINKGITP
jgi:hypothetical protein